MSITTLLGKLLNRPHTTSVSLADYKQEALIRQGRTQFEKLLKKGLQVPIVLL